MVLVETVVPVHTFILNTSIQAGLEGDLSCEVQGFEGIEDDCQVRVLHASSSLGVDLHLLSALHLHYHGLGEDSSLGVDLLEVGLDHSVVDVEPFSVNAPFDQQPIGRVHEVFVPDLSVSYH